MEQLGERPGFDSRFSILDSRFRRSIPRAEERVSATLARLAAGNVRAIRLVPFARRLREHAVSRAVLLHRAKNAGPRLLAALLRYPRFIVWHFARLRKRAPCARAGEVQCRQERSKLNVHVLSSGTRARARRAAPRRQLGGDDRSPRVTERDDPSDI